MIDFNLWKEVLTNPIETFKKEEKKADLGQGVIHLAIAGVISGFIGGLATFTGLTAVGSMGGLGTGMMGAGMGAFAFVGSLIMTPIITVIGWLIFSGIIYAIAMIFGAKGDFKKQSYLIALYGAPLMIITSILNIIPFVGGILGFLAFLYGLYLLTMALKQVHKISTGRALAIWLIPAVVIGLLFVVLAGAAYMTMLPLIATGM